MFSLPAQQQGMFTPGAVPRKPTLRDRLLSAVDVADEAESASYFPDGDFRYAETLRGEDSPTGRTRILINDSKFKGKPESYRDKMAILESLHVLESVAPESYKKLWGTATSDPEYMASAKNSYNVMTGKIPNPETGQFIHDDEREKRSFDDWHKLSRFDQVVGGYLMAGDKDIPTAKNWSRDAPIYGSKLPAEIERLAGELEWKDR
jgi:hypothetical protein